MPTYKTPGVYVEEISTLPPSVAEVSTAIPAFIGYTEKAVKDGEDLKDKPTRVTTLLDYEQMFGKPFPIQLTATGSGANITIPDPDLKYLMCYAVNMYFKNGGGPCYIVSVGPYNTTSDLNKEDIVNGVNALKAEDEPTLIVVTDAVNLVEDDYHEVCKAVLIQCGELKDRFAIFDVKKKDKDAVGAFRTGIGADYLMYGAAYHPYLQTSLNYYYTDNAVTVKDGTGAYKPNANGILVTYAGLESENPKVKIADAAGEDRDIGFTISGTSDNTLTIKLPSDSHSPDVVVSAWNSYPTKGKFDIEKVGT
ncbi:MAG: phage tail sheath family protein, partial [Deltaproteobacteria bacterium]|nr:phage tail sheath family protein [Deltaproteobacteria bacterium]